MLEIAYRFGFDAAHYFGHFPPTHPNRGMHGHSFQVEVALAGEPDRGTGFVVDFAEVEAACARVRGQLDHRVLNDIEGLATPSLENISRWIWDALRKDFPRLARVTVRRNSCGQSCTYSEG
jgi:6-pyruvoyltetrahydropterin/6-carboxytetrahydropterin synthase